MTYFDSTGAPTKKLARYEEKASWQDSVVLDYFIRNAPGAVGPSHCHRYLIEMGAIDRMTPITSIRRSITTLTGKGLLEKTDHKSTGPHGRPEFCWRFVGKC